MNIKHSVTFEWCLYPESAANIFRFCRKNISWNDILHSHKHHKGHWSFSPQSIPAEDMKWIKALWDRPDKMSAFMEPRVP